MLKLLMTMIMIMLCPQLVEINLGKACQKIFIHRYQNVKISSLIVEIEGISFQCHINDIFLLVFVVSGQKKTLPYTVLKGAHETIRAFVRGFIDDANCVIPRFRMASRLCCGFNPSIAPMGLIIEALEG